MGGWLGRLVCVAGAVLEKLVARRISSGILLGTLHLNITEIEYASGAAFQGILQTNSSTCVVSNEQPLNERQQKHLITQKLYTI